MLWRQMTLALSVQVYTCGCYTLTLYMCGCYTLTLYTCGCYTLTLYTCGCYTLTLYTCGCYTVTLYTCGCYTVTHVVGHGPHSWVLTVGFPIYGLQLKANTLQLLTTLLRPAAGYSSSYWVEFPPSGTFIEPMSLGRISTVGYIEPMSLGLSLIHI